MENGAIIIPYLPTAEMPADSLTKLLTRQKVVDCSKLKGMNA